MRQKLIPIAKNSGRSGTLAVAMTKERLEFMAAGIR